MTECYSADILLRMGKLSKEDIQILQPTPRMEGAYEVYDSRVEAEFKCLDCGNIVHLTLHGQGKNVEPNLLHAIIQRKVLLHHRCLAIKNTLGNNIKKFFPDLLRGADIVQETERKILRAGKA